MDSLSKSTSSWSGLFLSPRLVSSLGRNDSGHCHAPSLNGMNKGFRSRQASSKTRHWNCLVISKTRPTVLKSEVCIGSANQLAWMHKDHTNTEEESHHFIPMMRNKVVGIGSWLCDEHGSYSHFILLLCFAYPGEVVSKGSKCNVINYWHKMWNICSNGVSKWKADASMLDFEGESGWKNCKKEWKVYPQECIHTCQPKDWINESMMNFWINEVLIPWRNT